MADLDLTYAGIDYLDRTRPLFDGTVKPWGATLRLIPLTPFELFRRVAQYDEFDAAEFSFSTYTNLLARGDERYIAIPFFPSRYFRHADIYVHRDSGISAPADLRGRRVGIAEYQMTAALWQRAFLQYDYGVHPREIQWLTGGLKTPGYLERNAVPSPPGVSIELIPEDRTLEEMVTAGELAALFSPIRPPALVDGSGRLRRLFPDFRRVEREYYQRTGFFPIMHLVVIRRALYQQHRWLAASLLTAFAQAQRLGWQRLNRTEALQIALPWLIAEMEETTALLGPDHWRPGFAQNYAILDAMCQYHYEQGLSARRVTPEEMFAPETHDLPLTY